MQIGMCVCLSVWGFEEIIIIIFVDFHPFVLPFHRFLYLILFSCLRSVVPFRVEFNFSLIWSDFGCHCWTVDPSWANTRCRVGSG